MHSSLLDELGALMSRKMRRFKRKNRKKVRRSDRVMAKDLSLPVDTHSQKKESDVYLVEEEGEEDPDEMMSLLWFPD
jgi:hypothetical protein